MNNVLLEGKSACLPAVCGGWIHFRAEMNENVGGNQRKRRDVFFEICTKDFRICTNFPKALPESCQRKDETFSECRHFICSGGVKIVI